MFDISREYKELYDKCMYLEDKASHYLNKYNVNSGNITHEELSSMHDEYILTVEA